MSDPTYIRVMIVDDHPIVRDGLISLLAAHDDLLLCAEVGSGQKALKACRQETPDVVLMDMVMPDMDGPQTTEAILREFQL